ncbi:MULTISPECIES: hypothetical protein [unclassified Burkholderia]|uniref:hypothetical protein n=1 Tax=unclassified Burkholderia TaxID=2613784 RepID=UPI0021AB6A2A|nr:MULTISPECIES: hypothetical protein [unclassified Burkholderia]
MYEDVEGGLSLHLEDGIDSVDENEQELAGDIEEAGRQALHIDHVFLRRQAPDYLGTVAFALCAITAHCLGYRRITLLAGGGEGYDEHLIGYRYWPKIGFDAPTEPHERAIPAFADCWTAQDLIACDHPWWEVHGSQRLMEFDLGSGSRSWAKPLDYLLEKDLI